MDPQLIYQKYLESAVRFLSFRPRSEKEVRDNLLKKKASSEIIDKVVNWLKEQRFVNDEEFVKWWIEQRGKFRPKGTRIIKMELIQKGIAQEIIEKLMANGEENREIELNMAKKIVKKKLPKYRSLEKREIYNKLGSHLARKGFDWDTIKKSIDDEL